MLRTRLTTANVLSSLDRSDAAECLGVVLEGKPDIVALQEWRLTRAGVLRRQRQTMSWITSVPGDCVIGLCSARFKVIATRQVALGGLGLADHRSRALNLLPPRWVSVVEAMDGATNQRVGVVSFHLVPGTQRSGGYREDRPRNAQRHQQEVRRLRAVTTGLVERCDTVWAAGDSNFHGLALAPLTSAWSGRPGAEGTLGSYRRIDDVFSTEPAIDLRLLRSHSDHAFVQVDYEARTSR